MVVLTAFRTERAVPAVIARAATSFPTQRGAVVADGLARTVVPGTRTLAIAQSVLRTPSRTAVAPRTRPPLRKWLVSHEIPRRPVVARQKLGVCHFRSTERVAGVVGAANLSTGRPDHLSVVTAHFAVHTGHCFVRVVRLFFVPHLNSERQVHGARPSVEILTNVTVFRVLSLIWVSPNTAF